MSTPSHRPEPAAAASDKSLAANRAFLADVAKSVRRIRGDEAYDASGVRKIWHQGQKQIELLSWERRDGGVVKQELSFMGLLLDFNDGSVRTGRIPIESERSIGARPASDLMTMDAEPSPQALDYASHLLKSVPDRDFYVQYLLKAVNGAIASLGIDTSRTVVSTLDALSRGREAPRTPPLGRGRLITFGLLVLAGATLAFALAWLLT